MAEVNRVGRTFGGGQLAMMLDQRVLPGLPKAKHGVRRHPRFPFSVPVTLRHLLPGGITSSHGMSIDISEGGLGAILQDGLRVDETVTIDLPLPCGALSMAAIVRHTCNGRSGLEFLGLTPEERRQISASISPSAAQRRLSDV